MSHGIPASDIWWPLLETCSNLFIWGHTALVLKSGSQSSYVWQVDGMHPTGMLSFYFMSLLDMELLRLKQFITILLYQSSYCPIRIKKPGTLTKFKLSNIFSFCWVTQKRVLIGTLFIATFLQSILLCFMIFRSNVLQLSAKLGAMSPNKLFSLLNLSACCLNNCPR